MISMNGQSLSNIAMSGQIVRGIASDGKIIYSGAAAKQYALISAESADAFGFSQCIASEVLSGAQNLRIVQKIMYTKNASGSLTYRVEGKTGSYRSAIGISNTGMIQYAIGSTSPVLTAFPLELNAWVELDFHVSGNSLSIRKDGVLQGSAIPFTWGSGTPAPITLFAANDTSVYKVAPAYHVPCKKQWVKMYIGDTLRHHFVAVPSGDTFYSDSAAPSNCMWDNVTRKYFENIGGGVFKVEVVG